MEDIFEFWSRMPPQAGWHPDDTPILDTVPHGFDERCLPGAYIGPLKTAPVVLLYLSPGWDPFDVEHAKTADGISLYQRQRTGFAPLPSQEQHKPAYKWWKSKLNQFSVLPVRARSSVAFLNLAPYKSKEFQDKALISALPSSRTAINWAQSELFQQAREGERVVVCLRSSLYWGLPDKQDEPIGEALFSPRHTRNGFTLKEGDMRAAIAKAIANRLR